MLLSFIKEIRIDKTLDHFSVSHIVDLFGSYELFIENEKVREEYVDLFFRSKEKMSYFRKNN